MLLKATLEDFPARSHRVRRGMRSCYYPGKTEKAVSQTAFPHHVSGA